jgi:hypothetical protein
MANYQESTVTGTTWKRCNKIEIRNPYQGAKLAIFLEEELTSLANGKIIQEPSTNIQESFSDPAKVVELVDPTTGASLGNTVTYQEIYVILHSLYMQLANERDNPPIPPTE